MFATDTQNMQVEVLKKGAKALAVWAGAKATAVEVGSPDQPARLSAAPNSAMAQMM